MSHAEKATAASVSPCYSVYTEKGNCIVISMKVNYIEKGTEHTYRAETATIHTPAIESIS